MRAVKALERAEGPLNGRALVTQIRKYFKHTSKSTARRIIQRAWKEGLILRSRLRFKSGHVYCLQSQNAELLTKIRSEVSLSDSGLKRLLKVLAAPRCLSMWDAAKISAYPVREGTGSHGSTLQEIIGNAEQDGLVTITPIGDSKGYIDSQNASFPSQARTTVLRGHLLTLPGVDRTHLVEDYIQHMVDDAKITQDSINWLRAHGVSKPKFRWSEDVGGMAFDAIGTCNTRGKTIPLIVDVNVADTLLKEEVIGLQERVLVAFMKHKEYGRRKNVGRRGVQTYCFTMDWTVEAKSEAERDRKRIVLVPFSRLRELRPQRMPGGGVVITDLSPTEFRMRFSPRVPQARPDSPAKAG